MARVEVEPLRWDDEFLPWFESWWTPGEHGSLIAPTGAGKTTFAAGILNRRRYVAAADPKGGDGTLAGYGWPRIARFPGGRALERQLIENDEHDRPSRYLIGPKARTRAEQTRLRHELRVWIEGLHDMGGWTLYLDELQILTDPRMFNLRTEVDNLLIAGRDSGLSVVSSYQAPSWVTPHAAKMSTWVAVSYTRDTDVVNRLAEVLGRPKPEIRAAVENLEEFSWVIVGRNPREPIRVTMPAYLAPKRS